MAQSKVQWTTTTLTVIATRTTITGEPRTCTVSAPMPTSAT